MQPVWEWLHDYGARWHDFWEIVGALGSAFAAGVALWLATRERANRKVAEDERDAARAAQRRVEQAEAQRERESQARRVVMWVEYWSASQSDGSETARELDRANVVVMNCSDMPVIDVSPVLLDVNDNGDLTETLAVLEPGAKFRSREFSLTETRDHDFAAHFRDTAGRHWLRERHGKLSEVFG
ncbi:hypothetical protein IF650_13115 [Cellulosimicrobium terreum]|nr:hypothetical protein [Cellulosimicrobium terreum]